MNEHELTSVAADPARPGLRAAQAELTRQRIREAAAGLLDVSGDSASITFKAVAARADVTEMTVYRHFPNREALLRGAWEHLNAQMGPQIGMPGTLAEMRAQHAKLYSGFDRIAPQIVAAITSAQGREMRASLNGERQAAFLAIVEEIAPKADRRRKRHAAALLQMLHSAYAWDSLREQWQMDGKEAAKATGWLIELVIKALQEDQP
jgi:AcrR family transcriptional regulator